MRKIIFLTLLFILPISIYLFLKFFAKNEFDIPVFYKDRIDLKVGCDYKYKTPYTIPDSIASVLNSKKTKAVLIVDVISKAKKLTKIREQFALEELTVVYLTDLNEQKTSLWKNCFLFLSPPFSAMLMDDQKQIRGYYSLSNLDDSDKLEVELKILLKKY